MNKQQALERVLEGCRALEQGTAEVRRVDPGDVCEELLVSARALEFVLGAEDDPQQLDKLQELVVRIMAHGLYLLVDEVDVVVPELNVRPGPGGVVSVAGTPYVLPVGGGSYQPTPVNGQLMAEVVELDRSRRA